MQKMFGPKPKLTLFNRKEFDLDDEEGEARKELNNRHLKFLQVLNTFDNSNQIDKIVNKLDNIRN